MPFRQGENVGPYRIIEQLGQGGMATVFKAYHPALDRYVAIKAMHPAFMQDPQFLRRFQREARVVAKLDHPNIVPVYDFADQAGQPYLVMKFIQGETLKAVLDRGWPSEERILEIVPSVGSALSYAHEQGVLHRDIKPSNVLLTENGGVFLADFGLARIAEAGQSTLSGDQLIGTPHYISPEQARGEQDLDEGTDIYSLGIVLYQLCVGRVPYSSDTPFSIIHDHIYTPLPLPRSINAKIPEDLEKVLLKALAKDRADRYSKVSDLVEAFEGAVRGISPWAPTEDVAQAVVTAAPPVALRERPALATAPRVEAGAQPAGGEGPVRRPRRWAWILGGLLMSMLCLVSFLIAMAGAMEGSAAQAPEPAPVNQPAQSQPIEPPSALADPVAAARELAVAEPSNPLAHFELGKALIQTGQTGPAAAEFVKSAELYLQAENYTGAAEALVTGIQLAGASPSADQKVAGLLTQALFLGAESGEMMPYIESLSQISPEWPPLASTKARSLLYLGQQDSARDLLGGALRVAPEDPIANAVMVDVHKLSGEIPQARELTDRLLARRALPPWLADHLHAVQASLSS